MKILIIFNLFLLLLGYCSLNHSIEGIRERLENVRPIDYITTEFVVINDCKEDFDVKEFKQEVIMRINIKDVEIAKIVQKMNRLIEVSKIDTEIGHIEADRTISKFLFDIGLSDISITYNLVSKWYADERSNYKRGKV